MKKTLSSLRVGLYRIRHILGAMVAIAVAWVPLLNSIKAYEPMASHGECGFLCMFLISAVFWLVTAIFAAALSWFATVMLLRLVCGKGNNA